MARVVAQVALAVSLPVMVTFVNGALRLRGGPVALRQTPAQGGILEVCMFSPHRFTIALAGSSLLTAACAEEPQVVQPVEVVTQSIAEETGGTVTSPSGSVELQIPPRTFIADAEVTLIEAPASDVGNAALSPRVSIASSVDGVIGFSAVLRFEGIAALDDVAAQNLVVGVGLPPFDTFIAASESTETPGVVEANISALGSFVLVDRGVLEGGPEPEGEPEGEPEAFGQCADSCLSQSDQPCCLTCGGCAADACSPVCPSGTDWDCELSCCFDYDQTQCVDL